MNEAKETTTGTPVAPELLPGELTPLANPDATTEGDPVPRLEREKVNPYVRELANQLVWYTLPGASVTELAHYIYVELITPKNKRIHDLTADLARERAQIEKLGKTLRRYNTGEWHEARETAIDCANRLLSPVPDQMPSRDRP